MINTRKAFSLIELLMASMAFTVIMIGLASTFQANISTGKSLNDMALCQRELKEGLRLLAEGDNSMINPQPGLLEADKAEIISGRLQYSTNGETQKYEVWEAQGQLLRRQIFPNILPSKSLMGEFNPPGVLKSRLMLAINSMNLVSGNYTIAQFDFTIHCDIDGNNRWTDDEMRMQIQPIIFLRNSGQ